MITRKFGEVVGVVVAAILLGGLLASGDARAQTSSAGSFASPPVYSDGGLAAVVFTGGTAAQLEAAASQVGATGAWVQDGIGEFRLLVVDGPAFLGTAFRAAFPSGFGPTAATLTGRTIAQLKYVVIDRFGQLWYCDPDFYPIARQDEETLAPQRFPEIRADLEVFSAILAHIGYAPAPTYTTAQMLAIYREWKMQRALVFERSGSGYHFMARFTMDQKSGALVDGTIDRAGRITVVSQTPAGQPICPICLAAGARIDTPLGPIPVEALREGMAVWTKNAGGARISAVVDRAGSMTAAPDHDVVRVVLDDGRDVTASPGHPLGDGRLLGDFVVGDSVDGARVLVAERIPYDGGVTYDVLPSGPTGVYWANGVPLRSTIAR